MGLDGKRILVTGAGKGIGEATARLLASRGATVVALSRSQDGLDRLSAETGCETIACDLAQLDDIQKGIQDALPLDGLVNNAGTTELEPFLETSLASFDHLMTVNTKAAMVIAQVAARDMIERSVAGAIVNVSSVAASIGIADHASYCASKAALDALTRVMALELGVHGIRVNSVNPAVTLTPMAVKAWSDPAKADPVKNRIPMGRFIDPSEVADVIAYLLDDGASMVTGHSLAIDGGLLIT
ncbi:MAG: SDR family oxidoreductase [Pseudomonadota bacterium]